MSTQKLILPVVLFAALLSAKPIVADEGKSGGDNPVKRMAEITLNLNHHPSAAEKDTLRQILNDASTSTQERALATAMLNMDHEATRADKMKLKEVMDDKSAPEQVRTIAGILYGLLHKPSSADKEKLRKILE